jgi:hypothetical protein
MSHAPTNDTTTKEKEEREREREEERNEEAILMVCPQDIYHESLIHTNVHIVQISNTVDQRTLVTSRIR